ncbi:MAG: nucleotidyl transferase AbiEii/AbiGii toxin family protein [Chitinivibrionales bacterium]
MADKKEQVQTPYANNHLLEILAALNKADVKYVVCGGVAVVLHGVERMTLDLDLSVDMQRENMQRFLDVMKALHLHPRVPLPPEVLLDSEKVQAMIEEKNALVFTFVDSDNPYRQVDVFLTEEHSYDLLAEDAHQVSIGEDIINVVSRERLIAMKQKIKPLRLKDRFDLEHLLELMHKSERL